MMVDFDTETYSYEAPSAASVPDEGIDAPKSQLVLTPESLHGTLCDDKRVTSRVFLLEVLF